MAILSNAEALVVCSYAGSRMERQGRQGLVKAYPKFGACILPNEAPTYTEVPSPSVRSSKEQVCQALACICYHVLFLIVSYISETLIVDKSKLFLF